jgi:hypothetical protein
MSQVESLHVPAVAPLCVCRVFWVSCSIRAWIPEREKSVAIQIGSFGIGAVIAAAAFVSTSTQAGVLSFTQKVVWEVYTNSQGAAFAGENFDGLANGFQASPLSGTAGSVNWTASSSGGLFVDSGRLSTNTPAPLSLTFGPDVRAIGGNFFGTNFDFNVVTTVITVSLANGTSFSSTVSSSNSFVGFYSTDSIITSLTFSAAPASGSGDVYPTIDNVQFGVLAIPAPGALVALAAGSVLGLRRRRR